VRSGRAGAELTAVFLDRDGVLNRKAPEGEYVTSVDDLVMLPGAAEAVTLLADTGLRLFVVTNQRGIARGHLAPATLDAIHTRLADALGGFLEGIYVCPHEGGCDCRKPRIGLFERAAAEHDLDLTATAVIGDRASDMVAAERIGALRVHVRGLDEPLPDTDYEAADVLDAARWLLADRAAPDRP
jgi:histidinol-phosphate phosphatase family protein